MTEYIAICICVSNRVEGRIFRAAKIGPLVALQGDFCAFMNAFCSWRYFLGLAILLTDLFAYLANLQTEYSNILIDLLLFYPTEYSTFKYILIYLSSCISLQYI